MELAKVLTIAGSDCSGGAGIQADLKTMTVNGVYAMSVITALTAQNTMGVTGIYDVTPEFLGQQIDAVFNDICPDAIKIGMVSQPELIVEISRKLKEYGAKNIVLDPVMVATSGARLLAEDAEKTLQKELIPLATVITPNLPEAELLAGKKVETVEDQEEIARILGEKYGCAVLVKGGHGTNTANDLLWKDGKTRWFYGDRIYNDNTHGTGCTLSSAIAANLAKGFTLEQSIEKAKDYITGALSAQLNLGHGSGPMHHGYDIDSDFMKTSKDI